MSDIERTARHNLLLFTLLHKQRYSSLGRYRSTSADFQAPVREFLPEGFAGPYILSDKRYEGSRVLFYRYGAVKQRTRVNAAGELEPLFASGNGRVVQDVRRPYFVHFDTVPCSCGWGYRLPRLALISGHWSPLWRQ